jgi:hypothetical protein
MKHEILEQIWRVRDELSAEADHDVKQLARLVAREQTKHAQKVAGSGRTQRKQKAARKAA